MRKPMSLEDLKNYGGDEDLTSEVKQLIERIVKDHGGPREDYLRGFLFRLCLESVIDQSLLDELDGDAAAWSDGWSHCEEWVGTMNDTTFCPEKGDEFECYLVPKRLLEKD